MSIEEIIKELEELADHCLPGVPLGKALRGAIAKLRDYQALQSSDTCARLAAIKDIPTERVIALAQADAAGLVPVLDPDAKGAHPAAKPTEPQGDGWISVKDRLPERCVDVLVWHFAGIMAINCTLSDGSWLYQRDNSPIGYWRPLPEPPTAQPSATKEPYGCGVPLAGKED